MSTHADFDVGVIGGGPAGASLASYLAKAGARVVVFESELFPRPHVGESLVPSSTRVFNELGFMEQMEEAKFPRKFGAVWTAPGQERAYAHDWCGLGVSEHAEIRFAEREQPQVDKTYTFHVDRGKFDMLLLQHAHALGAAVYEGVRVSSVDFSPDHPAVHFRMGGKDMHVNVRMVADASGRRTMLGNQLKLKVMDSVFNQYAIHTWFEGYDRRVLAKSADECDYIYIHFLPISNSWIWQIPITDDITSIGVVTQKKNIVGSKEGREQFFWDAVGSRPAILEALKRSTQLRPLKDEGDYSYAMTQLAGDRFILVGDAGRFVDPIFSTGVSIALNSARCAHGDVLAALAKGDCSRASFKNFETTIGRGTRNWYDFISVYYRLNVLFTYFVSDPRYRLDVLKLLQGDVYDEERPAVLEKMRTIAAQVEQNPDHPLHPMLGSLTAHAFEPAF